VILGHTTDSEGFTCTSLTISKDSAIVTFQNVFYYWIGNLDEDVILFGVPVVYGIEGELFGNIISGALHEDLTFVMNDINHTVSALSDLIRGHGAATNHDLDAL
jgi:hypothetical protein